MPDNNAIAILELENKSHASNVFNKLHDFTIHGTPLYLEWAPVNLFISDDALINKRKHSEFDSKETNQRKNSESMNNQCSVYITNLNFSTTSEDIEELIKSNKLPAPKVVKVISKESKSMGFGFIDCHTKEDAEALIKKLQNQILGDHMIKLSLSRKKNTVSSIDEMNKKSSLKKVKKETIKENSKLLIRNIAFQSNEKELRELIKNIAELKTLRCPRKLNGELRGFGFAEFGDVESAKKVMTFLGNVHFYGRKLVVEYAKGESQF
jgi:multiple RNA-binding domain-containing protein 1